MSHNFFVRACLAAMRMDVDASLNNIRAGNCAKCKQNASWNSLFVCNFAWLFYQLQGGWCPSFHPSSPISSPCRHHDFPCKFPGIFAPHVWIFVPKMWRLTNTNRKHTSIHVVACTTCLSIPAYLCSQPTLARARSCAPQHQWPTQPKSKQGSDMAYWPHVTNRVLHARSCTHTYPPIHAYVRTNRSSDTHSRILFRSSYFLFLMLFPSHLLFLVDVTCRPVLWSPTSPTIERRKMGISTSTLCALLSFTSSFCHPPRHTILACDTRDMHTTPATHGYTNSRNKPRIAHLPTLSPHSFTSHTHTHAQSLVPLIWFSRNARDASYQPQQWRQQQQQQHRWLGVEWGSTAQVWDRVCCHRHWWGRIYFM